MERQRANLRDLLERGVYDAEMFRERGALIAERLERAERDRAALENCKDAPREAARAAPEYRALTPAARNAALKSVLDRVVYRKEGRADDFSLELFPRLPASAP